MSDERERQLREVQAYFRLPSIGLVEKDLEVVRAIAHRTASLATLKKARRRHLKLLNQIASVISQKCDIVTLGREQELVHLLNRVWKG